MFFYRYRKSIRLFSGMMAVFGILVAVLFFLNIFVILPTEILYFPEEDLRDYLKKHPRVVSLEDMDNQTILYSAIAEEFSDARSAQLVRILAQSGAEINRYCLEGQTPLHLAIRKNKFETVKALISYGAIPSFASENDELPIEVAAKLGLTDIVRYLEWVQKAITPKLGGIYAEIASLKGSHVAEWLKGKSVPLDRLLMCAAGYNPDPEVVQNLIHAGANVRATDLHGKTPLIYAALRNKNLKVMFGLIQLGAEVNTYDAQGNTPLHVAVLHDLSIDVVRGLLLAGANPSVINHDGATPYQLAKASNKEKILALFESIATSTYSYKVNGYVAYLGSVGTVEQIREFVASNPETDLNLMLFAACVYQKDLKVIRYLCKECGVRINKRDFLGRTPICYAVIAGKSLEFIQGLIELGARADIVDDQGNNLLMLASSSVLDIRRIDFLQSLGVSPKHVNIANESTLFLYLKDKTDLPTIKHLCELAPELVDRLTIDNRTPLLNAIANNASNDILDLLWSYGATLRDDVGWENRAIFLAIREEVSTSLFTWIIEKGVDVNAVSAVGTPLIYAISKKNQSYCSILLEADADPNLTPDYHRSPLLTAVRLNQVDIVRLLLMNGANPNTNVGGEYPLQVSFDYKFYDITSLLFQAGADPNLNYARETPLLVAIANTKIELMTDFQIICRAGADPDIRDKFGECALDYARKKNHQELVHYLEQLYKSGFVVDCGGIYAAVGSMTLPELKERLAQGYHGRYLTLLTAAIARGASNDVIEFLLTKIDDINEVNPLKMSPLMYVVKFCGQRDDLIELLLNKGANVHLRDYQGNTILDLALKQAVSLESLVLLLTKNNDINVKNKDGKTPIQVALQNGLGLEYIQLLLNSGASLTLKDSRGSNALVYAARYCQQREVIEYLLDHSSEIPTNIDLSDISPDFSRVDLLTIAACVNSNIAITEALLNWGLRPSPNTITRRSALSYVAQYCRSPEIVQLFLDYDPDMLYYADESGMTPLMYAAKYNDELSILEMLILNAPSEIEITNLQGDNAFFMAIREPRMSAAKVRIMAKYFPINKILGNRCALSVAVESNPALIPELFALGADPLVRLPHHDPLVYDMIRQHMPMTLILDVMELETSGVNGYDAVRVAQLLLDNDYLYGEIWRDFLQMHHQILLDNERKALNDILFQAISNPAAYNVVLELLNLGLSVNNCDTNGDSLLMLAIRSGSLIVVHELLANGADINFHNPAGETPLQLAIEGGSDEMIQALIDAQADMEAPCGEEISALAYAISHASEEVVLQLFRNGGNINHLAAHSQVYLEKMKKRRMSRMLLELLNIKKGGFGLHHFPTKFHDFLMVSSEQRIQNLKQAKLPPYVLLTLLNYELVNKGSREVIDVYLDLLKDSELTDFFGYTPLYYAMRFHRSEKVLLALIEKKGGINKKNRNGQTLLHQLVAEKDEVAFTRALRYKPDLHAEDHLGNTILQTAIVSGCDFNFAVSFVDDAFPINHCNKEGHSALTQAIVYQRKDMLSFLLSIGAERHVKMANGDSPMHLAVQISSLDMIKFLLAMHFPFDLKNNDGETPLFQAVETDDDHIISELLMIGADPKIVTKKYETILSRAITSRASFDVVITLLAGGAEVNPLPPTISPLILVMTTAAHYEYFEALLQSGVNPMGNPKDNQIPILTAAAKSPPEMLKRLMQVGADISARDTQGKNALDIAKQHRRLTTEQYLEQLHATNYVVEEYSLSLLAAHGSLEMLQQRIGREEFIPYDTLLICAMLYHQDEEILYYLLKVGATYGAQTLKHENLLHLAVKGGYSAAFIEKLIEQKVDVNARDSEGLTPLYHAVVKNRPRIVDLLVRSGADFKAYRRNGKRLLEIAREHDVSSQIMTILSR